MVPKLKKFKSVIAERGIKAVEIARELNISPSRYYATLNGYMKMTDVMQQQIANHLNMTIEDLFPEYSSDRLSTNRSDLV